MSADNVIMVVESTTDHGHEWRVAEVSMSVLCEIDEFDFETGRRNPTEEQVKKNIRSLFGRCPAMSSRAEALECAHDLAKTCSILEYGVSEMFVPYDIGGRHE